MKRAIIIIYIVLTTILAIATVFEAIYGTASAQNFIYGAIWFFVLWAMLGVLGATYIFKRKMWQKPAVLLLHTAFIVMLLGAAITWFSADKGIIHLRQDTEMTTYFSTTDNLPKQLPFALKLNKFDIVYYPATHSPANYSSYVTVLEGTQAAEHCISMNKILSHRGYRFYQASFDEDEQGTILSVNHDPLGIAVTYIGYILMALAMLLTLVSKKCGFRKLLRNPILQKGFLCLLLILPTQIKAENSQKIKPIWPKIYADSAASVQVIYHDRIVPFNTLARDFTAKLYGKPTYKGLTAEQVVGSWLLFPDVWKNEPMIQIKSDELRNYLGISGKFARYTDFFDEQGEYRLRQLWQQFKAEAGRGEQPSALQKAVTQADEKVALITMLQQHELIKPLPTDSNVKPLSDAKIKAELLYNKIPFSKILFMANLTVGFLVLIWLIVSVIKQKQTQTNRKQRFLFVLNILLCISFIFHMLGMILRGYISGRIPLSNGSETMLFVAWCILLISWLLRRKYSFVIPFGFLLSGFALLVAWLGQKNPQITPLMPVLLSPWLSIHVSLIMMSYALFGFTTLNGIFAILLHHSNPTNHAESIEKLTVMSKIMLYPAVFFLGIGIFIGAVWANVSWGSYWSWDPKEVWALITFLVYAAAFHTESVSKFNKPIFFHIYIVLAFLTVLMTYFGVNNLLGGMHSYK